MIRKPVTGQLASQPTIANFAQVQSETARSVASEIDQHSLGLAVGGIATVLFYTGRDALPPMFIFGEVRMPMSARTMQATT